MALNCGDCGNSLQPIADARGGGRLKGAELTIDVVKQFIVAMTMVLTRLADEAARIDPTIPAALFVALLVLSLFSRRWLTIVSCACLAAIGFVLVVAPGSAPIVLAVGAWAGALLVAISGIVSHRRAVLRERDHQGLIESVRRLEAVTERHFLQSLNAPPRAVGEPEPDKSH